MIPTHITPTLMCGVLWRTKFPRSKAPFRLGRKFFDPRAHCATNTAAPQKVHENVYNPTTDPR